MISKDHRVRTIWAYVDSLDFKPLYHKIQAVEGVTGHDAVDPKRLMALWMLATVDGVSNARRRTAAERAAMEKKQRANRRCKNSTVERAAEERQQPRDALQHYRSGSAHHEDGRWRTPPGR
jgi:hypothetical protein